jgi:hypothetical protein
MHSRTQQGRAGQTYIHTPSAYQHGDGVPGSPPPPTPPHRVVVTPRTRSAAGTVTLGGTGTLSTLLCGPRPGFGAQVEKWLTQIETYRHKVKDWQAVIVEQRTAGAVSRGGG